MSLFSYPAKFTTGTDGRVLVNFIDLPRVATDGKDKREAMEEAMDALGSDLSIRLSRREEPTPSLAKRGQRQVPVPLWLAPKLALYLAMRDQRVSNSELARRLGCTSGWFAVCSIPNTPPGPRRSRPPSQSLASRWPSKSAMPPEACLDVLTCFRKLPLFQRVPSCHLLTGAPGHSAKYRASK